MRRRSLVLAVLFVLGAACVPADLLAAEEPDLSLSALLAGGPERRPAPEVPGRGPGAALAGAAGLDTFPVGCATPLLLLLSRPEGPLDPSLRLAQTIAVARPLLEAERVTATRDGAFAIHFPAPAGSAAPLAIDRDRDGVPDAVDRLAEALVAARSFLVARLGYPPPTPDGEALDVFLVPLGHGLEGFAVPGRDAASQGPARGTAFLVLDADLPAERVMSATLHQVAHACLLASAPRAAIWWSEASASFLTVAATGDLSGFGPALRARQRSAGRGLAADGLLLMQGSLLWPQFLAERTGDAGVVRQIWSEIAASGADPLAAADRVLMRSSGMSLRQAFREFAAWNLFTGAQDDGRHYAFGRSLPEPALAAAGAALPVDLDPVGEVEPLGSVAFRLPGDGRTGSLDLSVRSEGGRAGADLLVAFRSQAPNRVLVPVPLDAGGEGHVLVPWADLAEAWIVLRNEGASGAGTRFQVRGLHDPVAPFDLASFTAQGSGMSIVLEWTTASEKGLVGWNVYRSESPTGPFSRLNQVAVPAYGDGSSDTGYIFNDDGVRPGRRYYYLVEGLTEAGLADRSHVVSGRSAATR